MSTNRGGSSPSDLQEAAGWLTAMAPASAVDSSERLLNPEGLISGWGLSPGRRVRLAERPRMQDTPTAFKAVLPEDTARSSVKPKRSIPPRTSF